MKKGKFIVVEGPDGSGKTTFAKHLVEYLNRFDVPASFVREPGGCASSEAIRNLSLNEATRPSSKEAMMLLMFASRMQLLSEVVEPLLNKGISVVCDRYTLSTYVYQVVLEKASLSLFENLNNHVAEVDCLFLLNAPFNTCLNRSMERDQKDRNSYDDIALNAKELVWSTYNGITPGLAYIEFGFRKTVKLDTESTPAKDLALKAVQEIKHLKGK